MANANMGMRSMRQQISSAVDLFVQVSRFSDGRKNLSGLADQTGIGRVAAAPIENPPTRGQIRRAEAKGLHGVIEKGRGTVLLQIGFVWGTR